MVCTLFVGLSCAVTRVDRWDNPTEVVSHLISCVPHGWLNITVMSLIKAVDGANGQMARECVHGR